MTYEEITKIKDTGECIQQMISHGYQAEDGSPIKCPCGSLDIKHAATDYIANNVCEMVALCGECNKELGYWAYGSWGN